jgi:hypothetical protein
VCCCGWLPGEGLGGWLKLFELGSLVGCRSWEIESFGDHRQKRADGHQQSYNKNESPRIVHHRTLSWCRGGLTGPTE